MSMTFPLFVGSPCGQHGPYTFYKAFKYQKSGKLKILTLGEFFFVRITPNEDPCIGELQLLWEDRNRDQVLSSMRLYFLPEQTPDGRMSQHGDHEVLAASGKVILKLADLVEWIMDGDEVDWSYGLCAACDGDISAPVPDVGLPPQSLKETKNLSEGASKELAKVFSDNNCGFDTKDIDKEKEMIGDQINPYIPKVVVVSYPRYCRYRSMLKRLEGTSDRWLKNALVVALGGFTLSGYNTFILFCRDTFDHEALLHNDLNCDHLAPNLKGRPRKRHVKIKRSTSPDSESNTSEESREINIQQIHMKNGLKKPACKDEQEFLQRLFKFMKDRNTPIHRIPHLGFKQIDLYFFYMYTQKLGGYERITYKKLWKHVYDELGGNPGSTSAATCTRRHYERLLLPFERYVSGEHIMELPPPPPPSHLRLKKEKPEMKQDENGDNILRMNNQIEENCDSTDGSQEDRHEQDEQTAEIGQNGDVHKRDIKLEIKDLECYEKEWKDLHRSLLPNKVIGNDSIIEDGYKWNEIKKKNMTQSWLSCSSKRNLLSKHQKFQEQENKPPMSMASSLNLSCNNNTNILDCMSQLKPVTSAFVGTPYITKSENKDFIHPTHNETSLSSFGSIEGNQKQCCVTRTGHLPVRDGRINSQRSLPVSTASSNKNNSLPSLSMTNLYTKNTNCTMSPHFTSSTRGCTTTTEGKIEAKLEHCSNTDSRHQSGVSIMSPLLYRKSQAASLSGSSTMLSNSRNGRPVMSHISPFSMAAKTVPVDFAAARTLTDTVHKNHVEHNKETKLSQRRPSVIQHTEHIQSSPPPQIARHNSTSVSCNSSFSQCNSDPKDCYSMPKDKEIMARSTELIIPTVTFGDTRPCLPSDTLAKSSSRITHQVAETKVHHGHHSYRNCEIPINRMHNTVTNTTNRLSITAHTETPYKQLRHPMNPCLRTDAYFHSSSKNSDYKRKSPPVVSNKRLASCYEQNKRLKLRSSPPLPTVPVTAGSSLHSHNYNYYSSPPSFYQCPSTKTVNCDDEVLDLSIKKKPQPVVEENISRIVPVSPVLMTDVMVDGECLDLSVKKNIVATSSTVVENTDLLSGIEDITPPPPPCTPPEYQNSTFVTPPVITNAHPSRVDNLKLSADIQCNRLKPVESILENHSSVHQNHMKSASQASDISAAQSPFMYKLRGAAKTVCVSEYNPRLPSFIAPPFYPFNPTSWTSPHYSATSGMPAYKEMTEQNSVTEPRQRGASHLYPFMYNNGCVYQAYTK